MKQVLVYHGKHGNVYWDATEKEKALWSLFVMLDKVMHYYDHLNDVDETEKILEQKKGTLQKLEASVPPVEDVLNPGHVLAIQKLEQDVGAYNIYVVQGKMLRSARKGNVASAIKLLEWRNQYEYEEWSLEILSEFKEVK